MKFKVGDKIQRTYRQCNNLMIGDIGTIVDLNTIYETYVVVNERNNLKQTWHEDFVGPCKKTTQTIIIYHKDNEVIASLKQGKQVIKSAKAKRNPKDEFNFEYGAKLAVQRLLGEDAAREVKRPAKVGEWVKVTKDSFGYKNGDVVKVTNDSASCYNGLGVTANGRGIVILHGNYVVLEDYQSNNKTKQLSDYTNTELIKELTKRMGDK